jgi:DNA polymerase
MLGIPEVSSVGTRCLIEAERAANNCRECSLWRGTTLVYDDGPSSTDLMFIGEAPGRLEDRVGRPFVGAAGQLLNAMLSEIGVRRGDVYVTNVIKHRPTKNANGVLKNRRPYASEVKACKPWLDEQVELINPKLIVPLGNVATQSILDTKEKIGVVHGRRFDRDGRMVIPTFHPAYIRRNPQLIEAFRGDFATIRDVYSRLRDFGGGDDRQFGREGQ